VLNQAQVANPHAVVRFRREAQAAARLKHPNVVTIYDAGVSDEGLLYFVMELVEGRDLRAVIKQQGPFTQGAATEIIRQVCGALDEAHRQNVVHRDLKPENIVVQQTPTGLQVKVLDFGIASLRDLTTNRLTQTGQLMGTPHYMSPEQCVGEELDGRSDIYSLGVVLFEMLTGSVPFNSPTPTAIVVQHVNQQPPPLRALNLSISPAVEAVVLRAMAKRREDRPQTAGALAQELLAAVSGVVPTPSQAPPRHTSTHPASATTSDFTTTPVPTPSWANAPASASETTASDGSSKFVPLLAGLILLLLVAGGLGFWWITQKDKRPTPMVADVAPSPTPSLSPSPPIVVTNLWEAVSDLNSGTTAAENALGQPDQQVAVIKPGGQLALNFLAGQFFGNGPGIDLRVFGPVQENVSYLIFVRDNPAAAWQRVDINRRGFPPEGADHDMGHHGVSQARQVKIVNKGNADLLIDAVTVMNKDVVVGAPEHHHH
jgi:serine/threonine protein kinase